MKASLSVDRIHPFLYKFCLVFLACSLPLSRVLVTAALSLLAANWLVEGKYRKKFRLLKELPGLFLFASVFFVYGAGLIHSANSSLALSRLHNMLVVLALPLIIGSSTELSSRFIKTLLLSYAGTVFLASAIGLIQLALIQDPLIRDLSQPSLFMLPIRFSLLVNMAIFVLYGLAFRNCCGMTERIEKILYIISMVCLSAYLFVLGSITGVVTFCVLLIWSVTGSLKRIRNRFARIISWLAAAGIVLAFSLYLAIFYFANFHGRSVSLENLDAVTVNGNPYVNDTTTLVMENGYYVDIYVCEKELRQEWNKTSSLPYDGMDRKGQQLSYTLRRYMTSMGLRKDLLGFQSLSPSDIANVENGLTNCRFKDASPFFQRLYGTLWEIHVYRRTGYVKYHSFSQRIVFFRLALPLIKAHPFFGTGTGDVQESMLQEAAKSNVLVEEYWKGRPHNQFLFLILAFGFTGFAYVMFSWIFPIVAARKQFIYLRRVFLIIIFLSMLVMDTLESYDSVVFFALFYCLFLFSPGNARDRTNAQKIQDTKEC